jgi:plastocyanin domain-containing protein
MGVAQLVPKANEGARGGPGYSEGWSWVRVKGRYSPEVIEARPGERLRLVFRREETAACSERVIFPSLGKSVMLPPFEDVTVDLGPMPAGEHEFTCELGVLRGRIVVRGEPARARLDARGGRILVLGRRRTHSVETPESRPARSAEASPGVPPTLSRTTKTTKEV